LHRGESTAVASRRHQPDRQQTAAMMRAKVPLVLCNGVLISAMVGAGMAFAAAHGATAWRGTLHLVLSVLGLGLFYHLALFYFHRAMHRPRLFRAFHHLHHRFKAPMFLDALYEHPLEAVYGGIVLSLPLYVAPVSLWGYLAFFSIVGLHEIIDHSGLKIDLPLLSRSWNHDEHHRRSNCYYGQLLPLLDHAHGSAPPPARQARRRAA
jgi:sterol desaturase/sphingolipid hydroxylase (fatty acid hydroxylase superfamily)